MDLQDLMLPKWDRLPEADQRRLAGEVATAVGGRMLGLFEHALGSERHRVATIERKKVAMALIPGGSVRLGWSRDVALSLTDAQLVEWRERRGEDASFAEQLATSTTPSRVVEIAPFLLEIEPTPIGDTLDELDGEDLLAAIAKRVRRRGFRLPTDDEWEHAARAGSTSLFRWGDEWPDGIPYGRQTNFAGHRKLNALGLSITHDPYQVEVVDSPLGFRAGDGGQAVCGGYPWPEPWISFASSFRAPRETWEDVITETLETGWVRRALSIPQEAA
jgi:hypothetical protein